MRKGPAKYRNPQNPPYTGNPQAKISKFTLKLKLKPIAHMKSMLSIDTPEILKATLKFKIHCSYTNSMLKSECSE